MGIYKQNGTPIYNAYHITGAALESAYSVENDIVFPTEYDYDNYTISNMFSITASNCQGFAVYNGKIAQVSENTGLLIIDIGTQLKIATVSMDTGHGNSCQFSETFYDQTDEFPLFYVRNAGVWVYRITGNTSQLIKKYAFSADDIGTYVAGFGVNDADQKFYTASYTEGDYITKTGLLRICEWDMTSETDNGDGTYSFDLIRHNDLTWFDNYEAVQGCCYHDGHIFIATGGTGTSQHIVMTDCSTLTFDHVITIDNTTETEGCAWSENCLIIGQNPTNITYKKVMFERQ